MAKITLSSILSGFASLTKLNSNFQEIAAVLNDKVLFRFNPSGEPNQMENALDMNGYYILNQGNPVTISGFNWKLSWQTATSYIEGDIIEYNSSAYICVVAHTSGVFADDLAAIKWQLVAQASLPSQSGHTNKFLQTNGSSASWQVPDALEVSNTPAGTIAATTVQAAINELDTEKWSLIDSQSLTTLAVTDTGTSDALVVTPTLAWTAYTTNKVVLVKKSANANTTTTPTLNVSSLGAKKLFNESGTALLIGALTASMQFWAVYDTSLDSGTGGFRCLSIRSGNRKKTGSFTRDLTASSGSVAITAVGFKPKFIRLNGAVNGTTICCTGASDGSTHTVTYMSYAATWTSAGGWCIAAVTASGNNQTAVVTSFDSDGFTLTWTKTASPTGTLSIQYEAWE